MQLARGEAVSQAHAVALLPEMQRTVVRQGFTIALRGTWICYTVVGALGLLASLGIKRVTLQREAGDAGTVASAQSAEADLETGAVEVDNVKEI